MAKVELLGQIDVSIAGCEYPIIVSLGALNDPAFLRQMVPAEQVLIVTNERVAPLYLKAVQIAFSDIQCDVVILADGEEHKNQQSLFAIYDALIQNRHHRDTAVIALGGGVIGDMAGFAASTYQRGVRLIQIPTTLLSQVDAAIGGKTAINHRLGKNLIGSFYQPDRILIDVNTLITLPEREFKSGLAEIIKYGLLSGDEFLEKLQEILARGISATSAELPELIARCCQIKVSYVCADEKELGVRALLNLGHTFAHALETYTEYKYWLHGEAVAIGLYCASILSHKMGLIEASVIKLVERMLDDAGLPHKIPSFINLVLLYDLMKLDKKIKNNCLRFVVIKALGECYLDNAVTEKNVYQTLIAAVEGEFKNE